MAAPQITPLAFTPEPLAAPPRTAPWLTVGSLLLSDFLALSCAAAASVIAWCLIEGKLSPAFYLTLWPLQAVFLIAYTAAGLYPGIALHPVEECRRTAISTSLVYAILGSATFILGGGRAFSRAVFLMSWTQALIYVPLFRSWARSLFSSRAWWGCPVAILGTTPGARQVLQTLLKRPEIGLKPFAVLLDRPGARRRLCGVPILGSVELAPFVARRLRVRCAIVAMPPARRKELLKSLARHAETFSRLMVIADLTGLASLWVEPADLSGTLGLEIRQNLFLPSARACKRLIDLAITAAGGLLALPLLVLIALAVRLTSRGPVFYQHPRYGRNGRPFAAWKFRTMVRNADHVLLEHLIRNPGLRQEWERNRKLRHDPRVTRVGRLLRRTSLDELPQLWNVLRNEMSLVGPRPISRDEVPRYGDGFALYKKVTPGITGLWQVSGRSETAYEERVRLDLYYISNWSVWMDLYILARTVRAVVLAKGAC